MERTLIKIVKNDDGLKAESAGTVPELATAMASLIAKISESAGIPTTAICLAIMETAVAIKSKRIGKPDARPNVDTEKSMDDILKEILRGDRNED